MSLIKPARIFTLLIVILPVTASIVAQAQTPDQNMQDHRLFPCLEDGLKSSDSGCQLLAKMQVARFPEEPLFWHLSKFPTKEAAEGAKDESGFAVEAEGQFWMFSFGAEEGR